MRKTPIVAVATLLSTLAAPAFSAAFNAEEATIPQIEQAFHDHRLTCHELVQTYLDRIAAYDKQGPKLNAILTLNSQALATADRLDTAFEQKGPVGPLQCVP